MENTNKLLAGYMVAIACEKAGPYGSFFTFENLSKDFGVAKKYLKNEKNNIVETVKNYDIVIDAYEEEGQFVVHIDYEHFERKALVLRKTLKAAETGDDWDVDETDDGYNYDDEEEE